MRGNNTRGGSPLRVGLIADGADGAALAQVVRRIPGLALMAGAGWKDETSAPEMGWFDDRRALMAQAGIEALIVSTSPRSAAELSRLAAQRGIHVWRLPPAGRDFAEAVDILRQARQGGTVHQIASRWAPLGEALRDLWPRDGMEPPRFTEIRVNAPGPPLQSWRCDASQAGGGALADLAYPFLEALVAWRGLPETVWALTARLRRGAQPVPRETEELGLALLRYEGGGAALVQAAWDAPPWEQRLAHHAAQVSLELSGRPTPPEASGEIGDPRSGPIVALLRDASGRVVAQRELPGWSVAEDLAAFAQAVREGRTDAADAAAGRHLAVAALLETCYLSARTGQPESPRKPYQVQGWPEPPV